MKKSRILVLLMAAALLLSLLPAVSAQGVQTRAPALCEVTFDGNLGSDFCESISVLASNKLAEADLPVLEDVDGWHFCGWSESPYANRYEQFDLNDPITEDLRLFAIWEDVIDELDVYVCPPTAGRMASEPVAATIGWFGDADIDWTELEGGIWWDDYYNIGDYSDGALFHGTFEAGKTYYGELLLRPRNERCFTDDTVFNFYGAAYQTGGIYDEGDNFARITYAVTIPAVNRIDEVELYMDRIQPRTQMYDGPEQLCLTSGVELEPIDCWWENLEDVDENYDTMLYGEARFEPGKTYYSFFMLFADEEGPQLAEIPSVTLHGGTVEAVKTEHDGDYSYTYVYFSVEITQVYGLTIYVETEPQSTYGGGAFYDDLEHLWCEMIDGPNVPAGWRTFTAVARIGYYFDGWYEYVDGARVLLSRDPELGIYHSEDDRVITGVFRQGEGSDLFICGTPVTASNAADVLGDGVFSYDVGTKTLTVSGDGVNQGNVIRSRVDGLTILVPEGAMLANCDPESTEPTVEFRAPTTITGDGLLTVKNDGYHCGILVLKDSVLTLKNADVRVETAQYGVSGDEGEQRLVIDHSNLSVKAAPERAMAVSFFNRENGVELIDCVLVTPENGRIERGGIFQADGTPANEVVIRADEAKELITEIRLTAVMPKAGERYTYPDAAAAFDGSFHCALTRAVWYNSYGVCPDFIDFEAGGRYFIGLSFIAEDGYRIDETTKVYVNGKQAEDMMQVNEEEWAASFWYTVPANTPFSDVHEGDFFYEAVIWAVNHDPQITGGTGGGKFSPDMTCSRAQVVTFLWRAKGCPAPKSAEIPFSDVEAGTWYTDAVLWAVENEITGGTGGGRFSPDAPCTRAQVVTFLWRAEGSPAPRSSENPFSDVPAGTWYTDAVLWAVENQITSGTGGGKFSPDMECSRGQIVTFLYRDMA